MKKILYLIIALMLCMPVYAQRGGGGNTRSSSPTRSSVSTSRPSSSTRSSSTATYRSSTPSRSSVSTRPSSPTRSSYTTRTSEPRRSTTTTTTTTSRWTVPPTRNESRGTVITGRPTSSHGTQVHRNPDNHPHHGPAVTYHHPHHPGPGHHHHVYHNGRYYRPHHYFYHPVYHRHIYMRPVYWDPWIWTTPVYWYGWWNYCYTYPTHDIIVVKQYVKDTYQKDIIAYVVYNEYIYSIVKEDGDTYLEIFSKDDELVFKHEINKKYNNLVVDNDSDGVWCLKKNDKDPLFIGHDDGFYIYEMQE